MDMNFSRAETGPGHLAISRAIADLASGDPVIVTGAVDGPFMMIAASGVTPQGINLMAAHARGLVGMVTSRRRAAALGLEMQPRSGRESAPQYTRSIEAAHGTTTGISAEDRALTIKAAAFGGPDDIVSPGHIFPQVSDDRDNTQAALALRLAGAAGAAPVAALCTILDASGDVAGRAHAQLVADKLDVAVIDASDLLAATGPEHFL
ncbi:MAG: 3,4-dihydroxy-2-butanone-4-phosphate synthase [Pseudomonadota bacterium]|nr:3,4-dihydroxy-2-butanone-4-phosphate synthase [Pseudomonadota bacterium]